MMGIDVVSKDKVAQVLPASLFSLQDDQHVNEEPNEGVVVIDNFADVVDHGDMDSIVLPLSVVMVSDQGSCSIGKLIRNIETIRKKFNESRARVHEVSYFPGSWQSHLGGSVLEQNQAKVPGVSVSSDPVGFEPDTPSPS
ncbi:hypothetical protein Nepgr_026700 [Nepenthes gracilis]|uniref:Uncharacterized protein n=1 Tax=Nepenthes gracilis TaxID=150966 RepID=A0AAD3TA88_NEPGR|nr:hypothetical protein Nepgr_026700 [Nepenthes gracilis]